MAVIFVIMIGAIWYCCFIAPVPCSIEYWSGLMDGWIFVFVTCIACVDGNSFSSVFAWIHVHFL